MPRGCAESLTQAVRRSIRSVMSIGSQEAQDEQIFRSNKKIPCRETNISIHIPPNGKRKIIDSKLTDTGDMLNIPGGYRIAMDNSDDPDFQ